MSGGDQRVSWDSWLYSDVHKHIYMANDNNNNDNGERQNLQKVANAYNKILNGPRNINSTTPTTRNVQNIQDGTKKLRRLILIEGIPHSIVSRKFTFIHKLSNYAIFL